MNQDTEWQLKALARADAEIFLLKQKLTEAVKIIATIGTTGVERTETIISAQEWLKRNGYENYL